MKTIAQYFLAVVVCIASSSARSVSVLSDNKFEKSRYESFPGQNELDSDVYKETEIDIDLPEDSTNVKVIIDNKRKDLDPNSEKYPFGIRSGLKSSSKAVEDIDKSVKKHLEHLLFNMMIVVDREMEQISKESRNQRRHGHRRPRSRPKRNINALLDDNNVRKILMDYFRQKQGEDNGNPLFRFG